MVSFSGYREGFRAGSRGGGKEAAAEVGPLSVMRVATIYPVLRFRMRAGFSLDIPIYGFRGLRGAVEFGPAVAANQDYLQSVSSR